MVGHLEQKRRRPNWKLGGMLIPLRVSSASSCRILSLLLLPCVVVVGGSVLAFLEVGCSMNATQQYVVVVVLVSEDRSIEVAAAAVIAMGNSNSRVKSKKQRGLLG